jgi:hypothetical protein
MTIMSDLPLQLSRLADKFISSVLAAMRTAPLGDLVGDGRSVRSAPSQRRRGVPPAIGSAAPPSNRIRWADGRRRRASAEEVQRQKDVAFAAAKALPPGFKKGDVMKKSGSSIDLGRALTLLVADGKLGKRGDRRKTRYWVK